MRILTICIANCFIIFSSITVFAQKHDKRPSMTNVRSVYTDSIHFFGKTTPEELIATYGSPLYVYNENILRQRCKELVKLCSYPKFFVSYSAKANTNPALLSIIKSEGCLVDAMSPAELYLNKKAGFTSEQICYVSNNVSTEELQHAIDNKVLISVDSLSQLESYGKLNPSGKIMIRINPGIGTGHHKAVITGGKDTKFGINPNEIDKIKELLTQYDLILIGINQHIGSYFLEPQSYLDAVDFLLGFITDNPSLFSQLEIIDFGGGLGIPYKKYEEQPKLDLNNFGEQLQKRITNWTKTSGYKGAFYIEPGRYIAAECGILLGSVHAIKYNGPTRYVGTDLGFNVLMRPILYDAYHDIEIYRKNGVPDLQLTPQTIVGDICETGDILANKRPLPLIHEKDIIGVLDTGAYGFVMSSNYNHRPKPAEVLIQSDGTPKLIRKRETIEDMISQLQ